MEHLEHFCKKFNCGTYIVAKPSQSINSEWLFVNIKRKGALLIWILLHIKIISLLFGSYNTNELTDCEESNKKKTKFIQESTGYIINSDKDKESLYGSLFFISSFNSK